MRDKIPRFLPGNGISAGLLRWPSSCGTRSPVGFLRAAPRNGRAVCCLDNTPVYECRFGNPQTALHRRGKSSRAPLCVVSAYAEVCPPGKHSDPSPADREIHSVVTGSVGWLLVVHAACSPENRSVARPFSRYSLAWYSRDRPPSVAVFYSAAVPSDPLLAITACSRWPPLSPPLPQSVRGRHPWRSARCNTTRNLCQAASSPALADRWCSPASHAWPLLRPCVPATSATLRAHFPAALVAGAVHGPALALPSDYSRRFGDRPSQPPAVALVPGARESSLRGDNSCCSPVP